MVGRKKELVEDNKNLFSVLVAIAKGHDYSISIAKFLKTDQRYVIKFLIRLEDESFIYRDKNLKTKHNIQKYSINYTSIVENFFKFAFLINPSIKKDFKKSFIQNKYIKKFFKHLLQKNDQKITLTSFFTILCQNAIIINEMNNKLNSKSDDFYTNIIKLTHKFNISERLLKNKEWQEFQEIFELMGVVFLSESFMNKIYDSFIETTND